MANYLIIGGDGKEYGPVTETDVRQWIAEGRLNAESRAKTEGDAEFRPLAQFPELTDAFAPPVPGGNPPATIALLKPSYSSADFLQYDYELDLGNCITCAWNLLKENFWPVVGASALVMLTLFGVNQLFGLITRPAINGMMIHQQISASGILIVLGVSIVGAPVSTVLMAGLFKYYLKLIRGETPTLGVAFSGFGPQFGQLVLLGLVQSLLVMLGYILCLIPGIYLAVAWYFAVPLVVDRGLGFWDAMELSRKMVNKHWFLVFACMLIFGIIGIAGVIACGIGILVTLPIAMLALMYAYETIFGDQKN